MEIAQFRETIQRLRLELALPQSFEFKYAKTHRNPDLRKAFFQTALTFNFRFAVSGIDKREAYWARADRHEQHWACATELAATLRSIYHRTEQEKGSSFKELIVVDDNNNNDFLATIKRQFRALKSSWQPESSMIGNVRFRTSQSDEMLQLADMVCGASGGMIDGEDRTSYDQISERNLGDYPDF